MVVQPPANWLSFETKTGLAAIALLRGEFSLSVEPAGGQPSHPGFPALLRVYQLVASIGHWLYLVSRGGIFGSAGQGQFGLEACGFIPVALIDSLPWIREHNRVLSSAVSLGVTLIDGGLSRCHPVFNFPGPPRLPGATHSVLNWEPIGLMA